MRQKILLDVVENIYRDVAHSDGLEKISDHLRGLFKSSMACYGFFPDIATGQQSIRGSFNIPNSTAENGYSQYKGGSALSKELQKSALGTVVSDRGAQMCDAYIASPIYHEFFVPNHSERVMMTVINRTDRGINYIGVRRGTDVGYYEQDDLDALATLRPHLGQALSIHEQLNTFGQARYELEATLDLLPNGVILLDDKGHVRFMNKKAARIQHDADGFGIRRSGAPYAEVMTENLRLLTMLRKSGDADRSVSLGGGGLLSISRPSGRRRYSVMISPLDAQTSENLTPVHRGCRAVMFIRDPEADAPTPVQAIMSLYDFTRREAQIVAILVDGGSVQEAARILNVKESTARSYVKQAFDKSGARHQHELVGMVLRSLIAV